MLVLCLLPIVFEAGNLTVILAHKFNLGEDYLVFRLSVLDSITFQKQ